MGKKTGHAAKQKETSYQNLHVCATGGRHSRGVAREFSEIQQSAGDIPQRGSLSRAIPGYHAAGREGDSNTVPLPQLS